MNLSISQRIFSPVKLKDTARSNSFSGFAPVNPEVQKFTRCLGVINLSVSRNTLKISQDKLEELCNSNYYQNILHNLFLEYLDSCSKIFWNEIKLDLNKLIKLSKSSNLENLLDREYFLREYLDLRGQLNRRFIHMLKGIEEHTGLSIIRFLTVKNDLIMDSRPISGFTDISNLVRSCIFRAITLQFSDQLGKFPPYSERFKNRKPIHVVSEILNGLTDYQYFYWTYKSGGNRNYLSCYCSAIEKIKLKYLENGDLLMIKRLRLVDYIWNTYVGFISLENLQQKFSMYLKSGSYIEREFDPKLYIKYISQDLEKIVLELRETPTTLDTELLNNYIQYIRTYIDVLDQLLLNLEGVLDTFKSIVYEHRGSIVRDPSGSKTPKNLEDITIELTSWIEILKMELSSQMSVLRNIINS